MAHYSIGFFNRLLPQDSDIRLNASHFNINVQEMPEKYRLPLEFSADDMDNRRFKKELEQIKNSISDLFYYFPESGNAASQTIFSANSPSKFYAGRVDEASSTYNANRKSASFINNNLYGQVLSFQHQPRAVARKYYEEQSKKLDAYA